MDVAELAFKYKDINIVVSERVMQNSFKYKQLKNNDPESGGIIVGKIFERSVLLTDCSVPTKHDQRNRFNFVRSAKSAQAFINKQFGLSKGTEIYLGEWHTHPEDYPKPSHTDSFDFKRSIQSNKLNSTIFFLIIVGLKGVYIGIYENHSYQMSFNFNI